QGNEEQDVAGSVGVATSSRLLATDVVPCSGRQVAWRCPCFGGAAVLRRLVDDADLLVRAAALAAAGQLGGAGGLTAAAIGALADPAWQVREGAAKALGAADPEVAVPALTDATRDANLDVRRAAVRSLAGWVHRADVVAVLRSVAADPDADVRAYARRALAADTAGAGR
ncbi:MAG TPA: HEAT repeat domain-containing protein, partial [Pilimelia sp.]|nr:HEAT repeat domain-containing protein [Pilimelia sp.]